MVGARLHFREIQIINTLFSSDKPMTSQDIVMENPGLSQSTVQAILRKLLKSGLVEIADIVHSGNVLARAFKGTEKAKHEVIMYMVEEYQKVEGVISFPEIVRTILETENDVVKRIDILNRVIKLVEDAEEFT